MKKMYFFLVIPEKIVLCPYVQKYKHFQKNYLILRLLCKVVFAHIKYQNSRKSKFFGDLFAKIVICPKISVFRGKLHYFEITLKKSFFSDISENINIFRKRKLFRDHFKKIIFCLYKYLQKYFNISGKIKFFERSFWNNRLLSINPYIATFRGKSCYFEITFEKSFFDHISENINISRKRSFKSIYENLTFRGKGYLFEITLKKSFFTHISNNFIIQGKFTFL